MIPRIESRLGQYETAHLGKLPIAPDALDLARESAAVVGCEDEKIVEQRIVVGKAKKIERIEPRPVHVVELDGGQYMICRLAAAEQAADEIGRILVQSLLERNVDGDMSGASVICW